jgi:predicted enzyme related to lactoylglutathione lyase
MSNAAHDRRIDYIEFPATDIAETKRFYSEVFGWQFQDYGPEYTSFHDGRLAGGFQKVEQMGRGGPLVVIYATDLAGMEAKIKAAGGRIVRETFSFPGGRKVSLHRPKRERAGGVVGRGLSSPPEAREGSDR